MLQLYFVVNDSVRNRSIISIFCKYTKIPYFYLLFENYFRKLYSGTEIEEELGYMTNNSKVNVGLAIVFRVKITTIVFEYFNLQ